MMNRRDFVIGTGAILPVAAFGSACGGPYVRSRGLPAPGAASGEEPVITALRYGITAPSAHNTQPWRFELLSDVTARLFTDTVRLLPLTDPPARQVHISHGTLLETVAIAATFLGHRAQIETSPDGEVTPSDYGTKPTASIRLVAEPGIAVDPLFEAIAERRSSRLQHIGPPLTADEAGAVAEAGQCFGVNAEVIQDGLAPLVDIVQRAMAVETHDDPLYSETGTWFRFSAEEVAERCDGLNLQTTGAYTLGARLFLTVDNFQSKSNQERFLDSFNEVADSSQAFLTLTTPANTLEDWIAAGRAYVRAQLAAGLLGLRMHPVSQALQEYPQMAGVRAELAHLLPVPAPGKLQMLVRLGRTEPPALSPRRPLAAMLTRVLASSAAEPRSAPL